MNKFEDQLWKLLKSVKDDHVLKIISDKLMRSYEKQYLKVEAKDFENRNSRTIHK